MSIGRILKFYRIEQNLTQEEVAESIVSPSYLSRIENDRTSADEETLALLLERLGINYYDLKSKDSSIKRLLKEWEQPLLFNDKKINAKIYEKLNELIQPMTNIELLIEFHVKRIRACIILNEYEEIDYSLRFLKGFQDDLSVRLRFFYFKHLGNYHWVMKNTEKSKENLEKSLSEYSYNNIGELEKADLYFLYSLVLYTDQNETLSFSYAQKSLLIFQRNYKIKQCLKLHIQIGICYSKMGNVVTAIEEFHKAKKLSVELKDDVNLGIVEHNIANMYLRKRNNQKAIAHLLEAIKHKNKRSISYFQSLVLLIYVFYQCGKIDECKNHLIKHMDIASELPQKQITIKEFWFLYYFLEEQEQKWEAYVKEDFFPQLKKGKHTPQLQRYANLLGEYYQRKGGYKKAATYYKLVIESNYIAVY